MNFIKKETEFWGSRSGVAKDSSLLEIYAELTAQQLHLIFRHKSPTSLWNTQRQLDPKDEGPTIVRNVGNSQQTRRNF